jgi:hypothetical protein
VQREACLAVQRKSDLEIFQIRYDCEILTKKTCKID